MSTPDPPLPSLAKRPPPNGAAAGPENELITLLKRQEQPGETFDAAGTLKGQRVNYQRLSVIVAPDQQSATVSGTSGR